MAPRHGRPAFGARLSFRTAHKRRCYPLLARVGGKGVSILGAVRGVNRRGAKIPQSRIRVGGGTSPQWTPTHAVYSRIFGAAEAHYRPFTEKAFGVRSAVHTGRGIPTTPPRPRPSWAILGSGMAPA